MPGRALGARLAGLLPACAANTGASTRTRYTGDSDDLRLCVRSRYCVLVSHCCGPSPERPGCRPGGCLWRHGFADRVWAQRIRHDNDQSHRLGCGDLHGDIAFARDSRNTARFADRRQCSQRSCQVGAGSGSCETTTEACSPQAVNSSICGGGGIGRRTSLRC